VHVVDVRVRDEPVRRNLDRGRARIEVEGALVERRHDLIADQESAVAVLEARQLVEIEGGEAVELHRAEVAAGALDPQRLDLFAGQRVDSVDLRRGVAAALIGDAQVAAKQVGAIERQAGLVEFGGVGVVPQIGRRAWKREASPLIGRSSKDLARSSCANYSISLA
jgi:hypothetical protein